MDPAEVCSVAFVPQREEAILTPLLPKRTDRILAGWPCMVTWALISLWQLEMRTGPCGCQVAKLNVALDNHRQSGCWRRRRQLRQKKQQSSAAAHWLRRREAKERAKKKGKSKDTSHFNQVWLWHLNMDRCMFRLAL